MDNCYICLEKTSIYYKLKNCNCHIVCHESCFKKILKNNKCIICKQNIKKPLYYKKINQDFENIFIIKILDKVFYSNTFLNNILKSKSRINFLLLIIYSIISSLITISLSIFILINYLIIYIYYIIKYRDTTQKNYEKICIKE
jgi:hypothetical protein